jgi:cystathionine beta-lyase/cystathionine gamma-synthase
MGALDAWLDPARCPSERPPLARMAPATRALHDALDERARRDGVAWLHPQRRTIQRDLFGSPGVIAWQEQKARCLLEGEAAWSELPHLYARYGSPGGARLITALRALEGARAALVTDSGMQAFALVVDSLMARGGHAIVMRGVYNKSKAYLTFCAERLSASVSVVDDGDHAALADALRPETRLVFAETFTNPLLRAQDLPALVAHLRGSQARLVIDSTIATPWGMKTPALAGGAAVVIGSLTKALGGEDTTLGGYIATQDIELANQVMDLMAMRGGALDDERAGRVADGLPEAEARHARRCASAAQVAYLLARHPRVERVFSPALAEHPDAVVIARDYARTGSLLSFRVAGADEARHRHIADVIASTIVPRYALSFDGLTTKVNHHTTVSEYFTPPETLSRCGIDRLIRVGIGVEDPDDLCACLNWALHHEATISDDDLAAWRRARSESLAIP